jgi:hypothetical protein
MLFPFGALRCFDKKCTKYGVISTILPSELPRASDSTTRITSGDGAKTESGEVRNGTTVFVIGPPRCGTTLLGFLLGGGPGIMSLSEPFLAQSIFGPRRLRRHLGRLARKQKLKFAAPPPSRAPASFLEYLESLSALNAMNTLVIKETFRQGREWDNVKLLDWVVAGTNPVIGITRHPYDAAVSTLRFCRWWRGVVGRVARIWVPGLPLFANDEVLMKYFAANWSGFVRWSRERQLAITRYEDLVREPQQVLQEVCDRARIAFHPAMANSSAPRVAFGGIGAPEVINRKPRAVHARSVGRKKELAPRLLEIVQTGCADAARELGYDL